MKYRLFFTSFIFLLFLSSASFAGEKRSPWEGYWGIRVPIEYSSHALEIIEKMDFPEVISIYNTTVEYTDFHSFVEIPLLNVSSRFVPGDPRYDDYMKTLSFYFRTKKKSQIFDIIYVPSFLEFKKINKIMKKEFDFSGWSLVLTKDKYNFALLPGKKALENHYLYQYSLIYGQKEHISFYKYRNGKIVQENIPLTQFTFSYFKDNMDKIGKSGVTKLILSQTNSNK